GACLKCRGIGPVAEAREEAKKAQDAKMILGDSLKRIADETDMAGIKVCQPAEIVENLARARIGVKCVDREIAPGCVFAPIIGERYGRMAAVGGHIAPQRGDFDRAALEHRRYCPMR